MSDLNNNDNNNVINLLTTSEFTDEHLEIVKNLMDWENIYPELFGNDLPKEIAFDRF